MNLSTIFHNRLNLNTTCAICLSALGAWGQMALAQDPPAALAAADSVRVWLADLDLSTPEGVSAARERVRLAARRVCAKIANSADIQRRLDYITCVDDAMAPSVAQIDGLSRKTFAQRFTHNLADQ